MASASTKFSPVTDGFQFVNRFKYFKDFELPPFGDINLGDFVVGLCGGMCFAALDYFHAGRKPSSRRTVPPKGSKLLDYLEERQFNSILPPEGIGKVLHWTLRSDRALGRLSAGRQLRMLRNRIDKGDPAVLALIRVKRLGNVTRNHQVIAWAYDFNEGNGSLIIDLYDPNHPRQAPTLTFDISRPSQGIRPQQSTGEPLRGFFVIDYKRRSVPPGL